MDVPSTSKKRKSDEIIQNAFDKKPKLDLDIAINLATAMHNTEKFVEEEKKTMKSRIDLDLAIENYKKKKAEAKRLVEEAKRAKQLELERVKEQKKIDDFKKLHLSSNYINKKYWKNAITGIFENINRRRVDVYFDETKLDNMFKVTMHFIHPEIEIDSSQFVQHIVRLFEGRSDIAAVLNFTYVDSSGAEITRRRTARDMDNFIDFWEEHEQGLLYDGETESGISWSFVTKISMLFVKTVKMSGASAAINVFKNTVKIYTKYECCSMVLGIMKLHDKKHPNCKETNLGKCISKINNTNSQKVSLKMLKKEQCYEKITNMNEVIERMDNPLTIYKFDKDYNFVNKSVLNVRGLTNTLNAYCLAQVDLNHIELISNSATFSKNNLHIHSRQKSCKICKAHMRKGNKFDVCKSCTMTDNLNIGLELKDKSIRSQNPGSIDKWQKDINNTRERIIGVIDIETIKDGFCRTQMVTIAWAVIDLLNHKVLKAKSFNIQNTEDATNAIDELNVTCRGIKNRLCHKEYKGVKPVRPDKCESCKVKVGDKIVDEDFHLSSRLVYHHNHWTGEGIGWYCYKCNRRELKTYNTCVYSFNGKNFDNTLLASLAVDNENFRPQSSVISGAKYRTLQYGFLAFKDIMEMMNPCTLDQAASKVECREIANSIITVNNKWNMKATFGKYRSVEDFNAAIFTEDMDNDKSMQKYYGNKLSEVYKDYCLADVAITAEVCAHHIDYLYNVTNIDATSMISIPQLGMNYFRKTVDNEFCRYRPINNAPAIYWKYQDNIRGGIVQVNKRIHKCKPDREIKFLDVNNLYGAAMLEDYPTGVGDNEMSFYLVNVKTPIEVKAKYRYQCLPATCKKLKHDLSEFETERAKHLTGYKMTRPCSKLCSTFEDLNDIIIWEPMYKYWISIGLDVEILDECKVKCGPLFKEYIVSNTRQRDLYRNHDSNKSTVHKLLCNSLYGKMLEDTSKRNGIMRFMMNETLNDSFNSWKTKNKNVTDMIELKKHILLTYNDDVPKANKNPWIGVAILDNSKLIMYKLLDEMFEQCPSIEFLYMDTDSFIVDVPKGFQFEKIMNSKTIGMLKDEMPNTQLREFRGIKPKQYCLVNEKNEIVVKKAKGVRSDTLTDDLFKIDYNDYQLKYLNFIRKRSSKEGTLDFFETKKLFSSSLDDKRNWLSINNSLPWDNKSD